MGRHVRVWIGPSREQSQAPEARMTLAADHQMIVDLDVERLAAVLISCVNSDGNRLYPLHGACLFQSAPVGGSATAACSDANLSA